MDDDSPRDVRLVVCPTTKLQKKSAIFAENAAIFAENLAKWGKKVMKSSKKWLFEKATERVRKFKNPSQFEKILRSNDHENEIFSLKFGSPKGGGGGEKFLQKLQKMGQKILCCFLQCFRF